VDGLLGPEGVLAAVLPGYETRPEQLKMARAVERCLAEHGNLLAEAGTGTGKTLAYLVPAVLSGRKVLISTATKTLQEQIFFKDIPLLQDRVRLAFDAAYLKGRANYLCLHRFESFRQSPQFDTREEGEHWPQLEAWGLSTRSGDRAELDLPESFSTWRELSTTPETCLGARCPSYEACFVTQMRRRAEQADILVVNHHLFFADLAIRSAGAPEGVIPRYDAVIFDEAHALESVATEYFGCQVSNWRLEDLVADAQHALAKGDERRNLLSAIALKLLADSEVLFRAAPAALGLAVGEGSSRLRPSSFAPLEAAAGAVTEGLRALGSLTATWNEPEAVAISRRSTDLASELDFIRAANSIDHVYWAERRGRGLFLRAAPIDVARELQKRLYAAVDTAIFTSATLTAEGRFDYFARRMGLVEGAAEPISPLSTVLVESPFDYAQQAALYLPAHLPEPNAPGFVEAVAEEIVALVNLTGGRAFALFTSLRNMEGVYRLAARKLKYPALLQGERPKTALLELFKREPSVLFAAHSFWEGVDVVGDALSLVVIDRLPFASPGDPLVAARIDQLREKGEEPFSAYQLPQAAIALRQGFGRLIRSRQDRGIVAILDRRVTTKSYGRFFLRSLPRARRIAERDALEAWLRSSPPVFVPSEERRP
jgi:ATP-dependent DNA helicase DinG